MAQVNVKDLRHASYGFFSESYRKPDGKIKPANHLGIDFPLPLGTDIVSHVTGTVREIVGVEDASGWNRVIIVWNGSYAHIFGHLVPRVNIIGSKIEEGDILGATGQIWNTGANGTKVFLGPHLHYGVNRSDRKSFYEKDANGDVWGFGRCPATASVSDAYSRGWVDPRTVLFSMSLAKGVADIFSVM